MATTTNFGWETPDDTDLVKDGAAAMRTLGNSIDTSFVDLKGGTTGQVLAKASGTDLDFSWVAQDDSNAIQNAIVDAKGDLIAATAADTPARLAVGTNGQILTADSTAATGLKWATPSGGGKILQVLSTTKSDTFTTTSDTYVDVTGLSVSITPSLSTSTILVFYDIQAYADPATHQAFFQLNRGSTPIKIGDAASGRAQITGADGSTNYYNASSNTAGSYLDSPATTSATTYKMTIRRTGGTGSDIACVNRGELDDTSRFRTASTITVMEIGA